MLSPRMTSVGDDKAYVFLNDFQHHLEGKPVLQRVGLPAKELYIR